LECDTDPSESSICKRGFGPSPTGCISCSTGSLEDMINCLDNMVICSTGLMMDFMEMSGCVTCPIDNIDECDLNFSCIDGFKINSNEDVCLPCDAGIISCINFSASTPDNSNSCADGYMYIDPAACINCFGDNDKTCSLGGAISCMDGYSLIEGNCV